MTDRKSVMVIGLEPTLIDFSDPFFAGSPGTNAAKVLAGLKSAEDTWTLLCYSVDLCLTHLGETAEAVVRSRLEQERSDCILIGAGAPVALLAPAGARRLHAPLARQD